MVENKQSRNLTGSRYAALAATPPEWPEFPLPRGLILVRPLHSSNVNRRPCQRPSSRRMASSWSLNVSLARALAKDVEIGKPVPTKWYAAVAEVLTMVYKLKRRAG